MTMSNIEMKDSLLGDVTVEADLVVLATGMVPATLEDPVLNLGYRQGPGLPDLDLFNGFADSNFICFQYETRRTGVYAAGAVRQPMNMSEAQEDATGAALKAIQSNEHSAVGMAVHPRAWDVTFPDAFMTKCTSCKRCTESVRSAQSTKMKKVLLFTRSAVAAGAEHVWVPALKGSYPSRTSMST